ncbi:MAG TPA: nuclear transport factor 2 family protein [Burkholderiales bacterium]|nr:nuclear transport factor 2 family protein [Burkholderiales bacterium]
MAPVGSPSPAAAARAAVSGFREALGRHLLAIEERDLQALADTVADGEILLVVSDGSLVRTKKEYLEAHRGWFAMKNWRLDFKPVHLIDGPHLGVAMLHLDYREHQAGGAPVVRQSVLTLVFENRGGKWLMVLDQNTPVAAK